MKREKFFIEYHKQTQNEIEHLKQIVKKNEDYSNGICDIPYIGCLPRQQKRTKMKNTENDNILISFENASTTVLQRWYDRMKDYLAPFDFWFSYFHPINFF